MRFASAVVSVVLVYALFAGLWLLLSGGDVGLLLSDPLALVRARPLKDWLFVPASSLLLYPLVGRLAAAYERELAAERARQWPPSTLAAIADASADAIFAKDEQGRYLLLNTAAAHFVGKPADQVIGLDDQALFPQEQAAQLRSIDSRVRTTGESECTEETLQTAAGERVFLATKGPLRGADGRIFGIYGISRDITERKQAEQALRRLADDLDATLQAIPDLMFELDGQGRYVAVKALNQTLLAAPVEQLLGHTVNDVLPAAAAATVMQALAAASQTGTDFGRTMALPLASGERHFELSMARKPLAAGQGERFILLSRDITARHVAEAELRQRNQELERFNHAAIERELRIVALKREVNQLALATGRPAPYDTSFADAPAAPAAP